ncbi:uncharacterized protein LOC135838685 [Planococcus citri]|uniref:uncharacterized protein LOC135838685 n=1 Tax=Planococcus citri TaxID=170843 RepID=UPI0031F8A36A
MLQGVLKTIHLYKSLIRSKIDYGSPCFTKISNKTANILKTVQNSSLRICIGALYSSPIDSIYCEAAELPSDFRKSLVANKFITSASANPSHPLQNLISIFSLHHFQQNDNPLAKFISEIKNLEIDLKNLIQKPITYPPWLLKPLQIDFQLRNYPKRNHSPLEIKSHYLELISNYTECNLCFTDGSKISNLHTGYAFSINEKIFNFKIHEVSSIFTAELLAIYHCLLNISTTQLENKNFLILSDSLSSLISIQNIFSDHPIVQNIHKILLDLQNSNHTIHLMYTPSHVGIEGNEIVDTYAKSATIPPPFTIFTPDDIKSFFKQNTHSKWQNFWSSQTSNKLFQHKKTIYPWKNLNHLNRREEIIITRLRIGHSKITHNHLYQKIPKPPCQFCENEPISIQHLLFTCPKLQQTRLSLQIDPNSMTIPDNPSEIQKFITLLKSTNLINQI